MHRSNEEIIRRKYMKQLIQRRILLLLAVVAVTAGAIYSLSAGELLPYDLALPLTASIIAFIGFLMLLLLYLQGMPTLNRRIYSDTEYDGPHIYENINNLSKRVIELEHAISEQSSTDYRYRTAITQEERKHLVNELREQLTRTSSSQIYSQIRNSIIRDRAKKQIGTKGQATIDRLTSEIAVLTRRGNLNLALGIMITAVGIGLLWWSVFIDTTDAVTTLSAVTHYVPRLALVALIELFAFFFLSLYRRTLDDIKYYQNELTNVEQKIAAAHGAEEAEDQETIRAVLLSLASTDRNSLASSALPDASNESVAISLKDIAQLQRILQREQQ